MVETRGSCEEAVRDAGREQESEPFSDPTCTVPNEDVPPSLTHIHACNLLPVGPQIQSPNPCKSYGMNASITPLPAVFPESPPAPGLHSSAQNAMGIFQVETFFGASKLALAAQTLFPLMTFAAPG